MQSECQFRERLVECTVYALHVIRLTVEIVRLTGNLKILLETVVDLERKLGNLTVFFNVAKLTPLQNWSLLRALGVDVYDR